MIRFSGGTKIGTKLTTRFTHLFNMNILKSQFNPRNITELTTRFPHLINIDMNELYVIRDTVRLINLTNKFKTNVNTIILFHNFVKKSFVICLQLHRFFFKQTYCKRRNFNKNKDETLTSEHLCDKIIKHINKLYFDGIWAVKTNQIYHLVTCSHVIEKIYQFENQLLLSGHLHLDCGHHHRHHHRQNVWTYQFRLLLHFQSVFQMILLTHLVRFATNYHGRD